MPRPPADAPLLNHALIQATALRLIDRDGLENLSMRKLAQELHVTPRSLYHYVPTKDALLHDIYISVLNELELPDPDHGSWHENLLQLAHSFRALCHRHRNVAPYFLSAHEPVARDTDIVEVILRLLRQAGVPDKLILASAQALVACLVGFILHELHGNHSQERVRDRYQFALQTPEAYPTFVHLAANTRHDPDKAFAVSLELLLSGVRALASREAPQKPHPHDAPDTITSKEAL